MALIRATYFSSALAGQNTFNLVLPNDVPPFMADANPHYQRPMKTLVLLHGYNGGTDDWVAGSSIQELAVQYNLAVIPSLLIGHTLLSIPYIMRVVTSSLANFDFAVEEAACSLGATRPYTFFHIVLPNIKSGIASACIMAIINSFNNVSLSAFLTGPGVNMLPIEIMGYVEYHFDPTIAALATIMMVATLGVMLLIEKTLGLQSVV